MLARHDGQVVLVAGTIPGERVQARIEAVRGGVLFARTEAVDEPSADRRAEGPDPACGGSAYAHIAYDRQLALKRDIIADAFTRIGRLGVPAEIPTHGSPERGYRIRARFHVQGHRIGFYREATHELCDAMSSGQFHEGAGETLDAVSLALRDGHVATAQSLDLAENVPATERALLLDLDGGQREHGRWDGVLTAAATSGVALTRGGRLLASRGDRRVADELAVAGGTGTVRFGRHVGAFFQGNRHLLQTLLDRVLMAIPEGPLVDLYAGCGLFGVGHVAARRGRVDLIESDPHGIVDLAANARPYESEAAVHAMPVEQFLAERPSLAGRTVMVDPPRTGLSREAGTLLSGSAAARIVYLSCDVATLARDARRLVDAGFTAGGIELFDLFPATAHVETLAVFER